MTIAENIKHIKTNIPSHVQLIAISKTQPIERIQEVYIAGLRTFGENKVQEIITKHKILPKDILWHLVGHLQTNKVKLIAPFVYMIHSVDSLKLLQEIDKRAGQNNRNIACLLQIHIAQENTKFGLSFEEAKQLLEYSAKYSHVTIRGLMGMATFTSNEQLVRKEFRQLATFFQECKNTSPQLDTLSMGMSGDYAIAIEEGSTMVRVGTSIFGTR